jgi:hypothetical protein
LSLKNNSFEPWSRYRKKLPPPAANQIAGNQKILLGMDKSKINIILPVRRLYTAHWYVD